MITTIENDTERQVADQFRRQGFEVTLNPQRNQLPFDLGDYLPDLLAKPVVEGSKPRYVVEVKRNLERLSVEKYMEIAQIVAKQLGWWRFLLVTPESMSSSELAGEYEPFSWDEIGGQLSKFKQTNLTTFPEAKFLFGWAVLESMLRRRAYDENMPIDRLGTRPLVDHLFTLGELDLDTFNELKQVYALRNRVTYGYEHGDITVPTEKLERVILDLAEQWQPMPN